MLGRTQATWLVRVWLAVLLFFGSEVLVGTFFRDYTLLDWLVRGIGYGVLAVFVLDVAVRYRIRDIYDAMTLLAMYGLLASLLITPTISFENFPRSILSRVLGGHTLIGFEMWGLFLALTSGKKRRYQLLMLGAAAWIGFYWGIWMRWTPEFGTLFGVVTLQMMFIVVAVFLSISFVLYGMLVWLKAELAPQDFQLPRSHWVVLFAVMMLLFLYQFYIVDISVWPVVVIGLVMVVCWSIIWFRREETGETLLDNHFPITPIAPLWIVLAIIIFVAATLFAWYLPLVGTREFNQLWLMEMGFFGVGLLWLPLVAVVLAMRALDRQMRTNQLL